MTSRQSVKDSDSLAELAEQYRRDYAEFIDIASHDLDAPLRKLGVLIEKLTSSNNTVGEEMQRYVTRINACLADMRSLIDNLGRLARVNSDEMTIESCDLATIAEEAWKELRQVVNEKKATLTLPDSLPVVEGNREQYRLLFHELFANAIKFAKKDNPPQISVQATKTSETEKTTWASSHTISISANKNYFTITISDNGIGFKQEYAEKIFKPFVQLHGKSEFSGNGIGLALSKRIIDNHRGIIYAESTENEGSRIIFILPQTIN